MLGAEPSVLNVQGHTDFWEKEFLHSLSQISDLREQKYRDERQLRNSSLWALGRDETEVDVFRLGEEANEMVKSSEDPMFKSVAVDLAACGPDRASGEEEEEEEYAEDEEPQAVPVRVRPQPKAATKWELEQRSVTHTPYRDWCPHCVQARGRADQHKTGQGVKFLW